MQYLFILIKATVINKHNTILISFLQKTMIFNNNVSLVVQQG